MCWQKHKHRTRVSDIEYSSRKIEITTEKTQKFLIPSDVHNIWDQVFALKICISLMLYIRLILSIYLHQKCCKCFDDVFPSHRTLWRRRRGSQRQDRHTYTLFAHIFWCKCRILWLWCRIWIHRSQRCITPESDCQLKKWWIPKFGVGIEEEWHQKPSEYLRFATAIRKRLTIQWYSEGVDANHNRFWSHSKIHQKIRLCMKTWARSFVILKIKKIISVWSWLTCVSCSARKNNGNGIFFMWFSYRFWEQSPDISAGN